MSDRAATVIALPLSVVESNIWDVTAWPAFLGDVDWVQRKAHERYLFGIRQGRRTYEVPTAVRWHARDHRVTWRELSGAVWRGELRLSPLNGRRTRVELRVAVHPRTLMASVTELLGGHRRELELDLVRLADRLATIPQPFNPSRLTPTRRIGHHAADVVPAPRAVEPQRAAVEPQRGVAQGIALG